MKQLPFLFHWVRNDNTIECACDNGCCHEVVPMIVGEEYQHPRGTRIQLPTGQFVRVKTFVVERLTPELQYPFFGEQNEKS